MHNFEDENRQDDFEIEFSDLPEDEERSVSGTLVAQGSYFLLKLHSISRDLADWRSRLLVKGRTWLFAEVSKGTFADGSTKEEIEFEIIDLPPGRFYGLSNALTTIATRLSPKARLWRLITVACVPLLALLLILGTFPNVRNGISGFFMHATPTPADVSFSQSQPQFGFGNGSSSIVQAQATAIILPGDMTPGPVPRQCPKRPTPVYSHEFGFAPVWVLGFDGRDATVHLRNGPNNISDSPNLFGWFVPIVLEVQSDYTSPVRFYGENQSDSSTLLFGLDSNQIEVSAVTLDTQELSIPANPDPTAGIHRVTWNATLFISTAGCYSLYASWAGGGWQINFVAGK